MLKGSVVWDFCEGSFQWRDCPVISFVPCCCWDVDAVAEVLAALLGHEGKRPTLRGTVESEAEGT